MYEHVKKPQGNKSRVFTSSVSHKKGDGKKVAGFVDNRNDVVAQHQQQEKSSDSLDSSAFMSFQRERDHTTIQRTEWDAKKYVTDNHLWRPGLNLVQLMATLYLECSPEFDSIYQKLIANLPDVPGPATDGYDPPTINDVDSTLQAEIESKKEHMGEPMPPLVKERVRKWGKVIRKTGLERRKAKKSDGNIKRAKMINAGGRDFRLYHTKTAPTRNRELPGAQGKSARFSNKQSDYFRTGAKNPQRGILGLGGKKKQMGDARFVTKLSEIYAIEGGGKKRPLLKTAMGSDLYERMDYSVNGQGHPGPKLGAEINSFTYNQQIQDGSQLPVYQPDPNLGLPKQYLHEEQYFDELWYMTDGHQKNIENYEAELFGHYRQIVSGVRAIYGGKICSIGGCQLQLVQASMGGKSNFFDYPAVIFEPTDKSQVQKIKGDIVKRWNMRSEIKMTERQSFGFLYPSISDLEKSIRIWPGQYQVEGFLAILQGVIIPSGSHNVNTDNSQKMEILPLLKNTLKRSMNMATSAVDRVKGPNEKVMLLFNRIASNYAKGREILNQWGEWSTNVLFSEATQIIENLNEAILHLSSEYDQNTAQGAFEMAMISHYRQHLEVAGYRMDSFYLTHSGQQASSSSMLFNGADVAFLKKTIKGRGPIYFETLTSKKGQQQIKLVDPAYNFTCKEEVDTFAGKTITDAQIYDITNLDPAELAKILAKNPNKKITLYSSLSKHFQFGTDSTNLGLVIHLQKDEGKKSSDKKDLDSYVPQGAVAEQKPRLDERVPAVPSELYHHAALLLNAQTGDRHGKDEKGKGGNDPQAFFMGHKFSDWHGNSMLEVASWVASDNQCGIHSLNYFEGQSYSRKNWLDHFRNALSSQTLSTLSEANDWLDQNNLVELATLAGHTLAVYEFNQQYGRWVFVAGNEHGATTHIGRVPHASGGGNDHWVPLRRL